MNKSGMTESQCGQCGRKVYTFMTDLLRQIPTVYCSKYCEANSKFDSRHFVPGYEKK